MKNIFLIITLTIMVVGCSDIKSSDIVIKEKLQLKNDSLTALITQNKSNSSNQIVTFFI